MQLQRTSSDAPQPNNRRKRIAREVFEEPVEKPTRKMSSSEDEGAGQAVCIDEGEENRQILQGNVCVFKTNLLSMQNEAIVLRSKKVQSNFVRNEMYYGQSAQDYDIQEGHLEDATIERFNSEPNIPAEQQPVAKKVNSVSVHYGGVTEEIVDPEVTTQKKTRQRRRQARQIFENLENSERKEEKQTSIERKPSAPAAKQNKLPEQVSQPATKSVILQMDTLDNFKDFFNNPLIKGTIMQTQIRRYHEKFGCRYQMTLDDMRPLMFAEPQGSIGCNLHISMNRVMQKNSKHYLGKLRGNVTGSIYSVYNSGENPKGTKDKEKWRSTIANIEYENNFMGLRGPRKLKVWITNPDSKHSPDIYKQPESSNLIDLNDKYPRAVLGYKNKQPKWNEKLRSYALNFGGRVKQASIKNFILTDYDPNSEKPDQSTTPLIFGKINKDKFNLQFMYPLSPLQAFCIALSSFDTKLTCQ